MVIDWFKTLIAWAIIIIVFLTTIWVEHRINGIEWRRFFKDNFLFLAVTYFTGIALAFFFVNWK